MAYLKLVVLSSLVAGAAAKCESWCNHWTCDNAACDTCGETLCPTSAHCMDWCNAYTCETERCKGCDKCKAVEAWNHCEPYCNHWTCDSAHCNGCSLCHDVDHEKVCASWCNEYTCGKHVCEGCDVVCKKDSGCPCIGNGGISDGSKYGEDIGKDCAAWDGMEPYCMAGGASEGYDWCDDPWCYVDKDNCDEPVYKSSYFAPAELFFSYQGCHPNFSGNTWVKFCECTGNKGLSDGSSFGKDIGNSCDNWDGKEPYCMAGGSSEGSDWCDDPWCYVNPDRCTHTGNDDKIATYTSSYFAPADLYFSYTSCDADFEFEGNTWVGKSDGPDDPKRKLDEKKIDPKRKLDEKKIFGGTGIEKKISMKRSSGLLH